MSDPYVETNCVFEHDGRAFESGGAVVTSDYLIAYPATDGILNDWHGRQLGTWRSVASWRIFNSWQGERMHQIEAVVNGIRYTGRGFGESMIYRGRRKAGQPMA
jgi:hypothetical protein